MCSAERGRRGASQMAPSTMFSLAGSIPTVGQTAALISAVCSQLSESHGSREREGARDGSSPDHSGKQEARDR